MRFVRTFSTRLTVPSRHTTSIVISPPGAAKLAIASEPERYSPPATISFVCAGNPLPDRRICAPTPPVLSPLPTSRTATRGARPTFRYTPAGASSRFVTISRSPSPSRSAAAIPCVMSSSPAKPHASPTSSKVRSPRLRKATLERRSGGKPRIR